MYLNDESLSSSKESRLSFLLFQGRSRIIHFRRGGLIEEGQSSGDKCSMKMWSQGGEEESEPRGKPRVTTELEKRRQNLRKVEALADYYSEA